MKNAEEIKSKIKELNEDYDYANEHSYDPWEECPKISAQIDILQWVLEADNVEKEDKE